MNENMKLSEQHHKFLDQAFSPAGATVYGDPIPQHIAELVAIGYIELVEMARNAETDHVAYDVIVTAEGVEKEGYMPVWDGKSTLAELAARRNFVRYDDDDKEEEELPAAWRGTLRKLREGDLRFEEELASYDEE